MRDGIHSTFLLDFRWGSEHQSRQFAALHNLVLLVPVLLVPPQRLVLVLELRRRLVLLLALSLAGCVFFMDKNGSDRIQEASQILEKV